MLNVNIHRGRNDIGGNCVELRRGVNFVAPWRAALGEKFGEAALPKVKGLNKRTNPNLLEIVISHPKNSRSVRGNKENPLQNIYAKQMPFTICFAQSWCTSN